MNISRKLSFGILLFALAVPEFAWAFKPSNEAFGHTQITKSLLSKDGYARENYKVVGYKANISAGNPIGFTGESISQVVIGAQSRDWIGGDVGCDFVTGSVFGVCKIGPVVITADLQDVNAHFDNDNFLGSATAIHKLLISGPDWEGGLVANDVLVTGANKSVVALLKDYVRFANYNGTAPSSTNLEIQQNLLIAARIKLGKALHTLQDFYAHTIWSDININTIDNLYLPITYNLKYSTNSFSELSAIYGLPVAKTIDENITIPLSGGWSGNVCVPDSSNIGDHQISNVANTLAVVSSGYFAGTFGVFSFPDTEGNVRCDHGGFQLLGIAKDAPGTTNFERASFERASYQAAMASQMLLDTLFEFIQKTEETTVADRMIGALLGAVNVPRQVALVVDNSGSMSDVVRGVRSGLATTTQNGNGLSVVTFDGTVSYVWRARDDLTSMLALLDAGANGGGGCKTNVFLALLQAMEELPSDSSIFLFTDAGVDDQSVYNLVYSRATARKIRISPVIMGGCGEDAAGGTELYQQLANGTGGMVFTGVPSSGWVSGVTQRILQRNGYATSQNVMLNQAKTNLNVVISAGVAQTDTSIPTNVLLAEAGTVQQARTWSFSVDSGVSELAVTVAAGGAQLALTDSAGQNVPFTEATGDVQDVTVVNPPSGNWTLTLTPSAQSMYVVRAEVRGGVLLSDLQYESPVEIGSRSGHEYPPSLGSTPPSGRSVAKVQLDSASGSSIMLKYFGENGSQIASYSLALVAPSVYQGEVQVPTSSYWVSLSGLDAQGKNFTRVWRGEHPLPELPAPGKIVVQVVPDAWSAGQIGRAASSLINLGADESITITARSNLGTVLVTPGTLTLTSGTKGSVELSMPVPANATVGSSAGLIITITDSTGSRDINVPITIQGVAQNAVTLTVALSGTGSGTVISSPAGISCGSTCSAPFTSGSSVTLTATPATGSTFAGWGGACSNTSGDCVVSLSAAQNATATFSASTVAPGAPTRVTATVGNAMAWVYFDPPAAINEMTTFVVTSSPGGVTASGRCVPHLFFVCAPIEVTGLTNGTSYTFTVMTRNGTVVSAASESSNSVTPVAPTSTNLYANGFESGSDWSAEHVLGLEGSWTKVTSGSNPPASPHGGASMMMYNSYTAFPLNNVRLYQTAGFAIPANADSVTLSYWFFNSTSFASFDDRVQVQVSIDGVTWTDVGASTSRVNGTDGWGQISVDLSLFKGQSNVRLGFVGISEYGNDMYVDDVSVDANLSVVAPTTLTLGVTLSGTGSGTVISSPAGISCGSTCSAPFTSGSSVTLTATPATGSSFAGWSGDCTGMSTCTLTMNAAKTVTATFNFIGGGGSGGGGTGGTNLSIPFELAQGWNLLGNSLSQPLPVAPTLSDPALVTTVWKWDATNSGWQFYAPSMDVTALQTYATSKGYGVLSVINPGEGYWVNAKAASTLTTQTGTAFDLTAANLRQGWNLVATGNDVSPSAFNVSLSATPPTVGTIPINLTSLWAWDSVASGWYFYAPALEASNGLAAYITSKNYLDFTAASKTLGKGIGFWVNRP